MKAILIICIGLLCCGFMIDTPESRREAARAERAWRKEAKARFDLKALHAFLSEAVAAQRVIEGVDLTAARINRKWKPASMSMVCGDWIFTFRSKEDQFELTYSFSKDEFVAFECRRKDKSSFEVVRVYKDEWIILSAKGGEERQPKQALQTTPMARSEI